MPWLPRRYEAIIFWRVAMTGTLTPTSIQPAPISGAIRGPPCSMAWYILGTKLMAYGWSSGVETRMNLG
ncbi:hypothetical protein D3C87_1730350 [compost metagenome]